MRDKNCIELTKEFLKKKFDESEYFADKKTEKDYRFEHSIRVANIGKTIAEKEGMDVDAMIIACLLHDISYCNEFADRADAMNHGRYSAKIARPFLEKIGMEPETIEDICYGIAIHVDDEADFPGERIAFALSIGDADNIDRFDAYRIFENLKWVRYDEMDLSEKKEHTQKMLEKLEKFKSIDFATETSKKMWLEKLDFQIEFYGKLLDQVDNSELR
ncbi:MAG: HD domain-containing protein [Oscillospiraceae bacterium]|nr:HD domain-containing protein [Oscillospiraceae bacterium]